MTNQRKWIDLSRFGVRLRAVPMNPLRGTALTVFEVFDRESLTMSHAAFWSAMNGVGFSRDSCVDAMVPGAGDGVAGSPEFVEGLRYFSARTSLSLSDVKTIIPGAGVGDVREMAIEDIVLAPDVSFGAAWGDLPAMMRPADAPVWVLRDPRNTPGYAASTDLADVAKMARVDRHVISPRRNERMLTILDQAQYRSNALVEYWVSQADALASGHGVDDVVHKVLPWALPLHVDRSGKVTALADVRLAIELRGVAPDGVVDPEVTQSSIATALVNHRDMRDAIVRERGLWEEWRRDPKALSDSPDLLWGSLSALAHHADTASRMSPTMSVPFPEEVFFSGQADREQRLNPLTAWAPPDVLEVSRWLEMQLAGGPASEAASGGVSNLLPEVFSIAVEAHAQAALARQAAEASGANAEAIEAIQASPAHTTAKVGGGEKHVDYGEKIGGARKDKARLRGGLDEDDALSATNAVKAVKSVTWPFDVKALRESGMPVKVAYAIRAIRQMAPVKPARYGDSRSYVAAMEFMRDRFNAVRSFADIGDALKAIVLAVGSGDGFGRGDVGKVWQISRDFWPGGQVAYQRFVLERLEGAAAGAIGALATPADEEAAWAALTPGPLRTVAKRDELKKRAAMEDELHRPHLAHVERHGTDWRQGRDVNAEEFATAFGFRAVEFGNWLPQDERQDVLNMAYESFFDLSQALELPPAAMSLGSSLALAFGSRGHGGRRAALAHFEPDRNVINLTRMKGAGTLAHEWFHAFDWWVEARVIGRGGPASGWLADNVSAANNAGLGEMAVVIARMREVDNSFDAINDDATARIERGVSNAVGWLRSRLAGTFPEEEFHGEVMERMRGVRAQMTESAMAQGGVDSVLLRGLGVGDRLLGDRIVGDLLSRVGLAKRGNAKIVKAMTSNVGFAVFNVSRSVAIDVLRSRGVPLHKVPAWVSGDVRKRPSAFAAQAEKLDRRRSTPYWATTHELFARAGAAAVHDRLASAGRRNDYLVYGSEAARHAMHAMGNPNPTGEDREAFNVGLERWLAKARSLLLHSQPVAARDEDTRLAAQRGFGAP